MAKTNFERWKEGLKPEDLVEFPCVNCAPVMRKECERNNIRRPLPICVSKFLAWANAESIDDNGDGDDFIKWSKNKEKGL